MQLEKQPNWRVGDYIMWCQRCWSSDKVLVDILYDRNNKNYICPRCKYEFIYPSPDELMDTFGSGIG